MGVGVQVPLRTQALTTQTLTWAICSSACVQNGGHVAERVDHFVELESGELDNLGNPGEFGLGRGFFGLSGVYCVDEYQWIHAGFDRRAVWLELGLGLAELSAKSLAPNVVVAVRLCGGQGFDRSRTVALAEQSSDPSVDRTDEVRFTQVHGFGVICLYRASGWESSGDTPVVDIAVRDPTLHLALTDIAANPAAELIHPRHRVWARPFEAGSCPVAGAGAASTNQLGLGECGDRDDGRMRRAARPDDAVGSGAPESHDVPGGHVIRVEQLLLLGRPAKDGVSRISGGW